MKQIIAILATLILLGGGVFYFINSNKADYISNPPAPVVEENIPTEPDEGIGDGAEPLPEKIEERPAQEVIGESADKNKIDAYHFGAGDKEILFVGGVHGGYSFNTSLVSYELIDYLEKNSSVIPEDVTVTVIPVLNPDGLKEITNSTGRFDGSKITTDDSARVTGRFNGNNVDLNRNFDCDWKSEGTWKNQTVSGGSEAFSEPESEALRDYVQKNEPKAVVVWFSAEGKVYPSACGGTPTKASVELAATYATASGYAAEAEFDAYAITGDMVNWIAGEGIPAISVLLTTHEQTEWSKNKAGIEAVLNYYAK